MSATHTHPCLLLLLSPIQALNCDKKVVLFLIFPHTNRQRATDAEAITCHCPPDQQQSLESAATPTPPRHVTRVPITPQVYLIDAPSVGRRDAMLLFSWHTFWKYFAFLRAFGIPLDYSALPNDSGRTLVLKFYTCLREQAA